MNKRNNIIYWIATNWLALAMLASGIQQIFTIGGFVDIMAHLGFPVYFSMIIGIWKLLGVTAILLPRFALLKEWAYAGFCFILSGAVLAHLTMGDNAKELFAPVFLLVLTVISWYYRPTSRKIATVQAIS